jgi:hypothetical protein
MLLIFHIRMMRFNIDSHLHRVILIRYICINNICKTNALVFLTLQVFELWFITAYTGWYNVILYQHSPVPWDENIYHLDFEADIGVSWIQQGRYGNVLFYCIYRSRRECEISRFVCIIQNILLARVVVLNEKN